MEANRTPERPPRHQNVLFSTPSRESKNFEDEESVVSTPHKFMLRGFSVDSDFELDDIPSNSRGSKPLQIKASPLYRRRRRQLWKVARSPWYTNKGARTEPLVLGVTGGTASGKTTVCRKIIERLGIPWVVMISMDRFYRELTPEEHEMANRKEFNWDHPSAFDWKLFEKTIADIRTGRSVEVPRYDFSTNSRLKETDTVYGADIVIIEGILVLHDKNLRNLMDIKVFVDADSDLRLARRIKRDIKERGRKVEDILEQYVKTVKPSFDDYIFPTKRYADLIVPRGGDNYVAINLLVQHVKATLKKRGLAEGAMLRARMSKLEGLNKDQLLQLLPDTVTILPPTPALRALHTVMRNEKTPPLRFRLHVHRVGRLIISEALGIAMSPLPSGKPQQSPQLSSIPRSGKKLFFHSIPKGDDFSLPKGKYNGTSGEVKHISIHPHEEKGPKSVKIKNDQDEPKPFIARDTKITSMKLPQICGVSIVRGGQALEIMLKEFMPEVNIGKIIIAQSRDKKYGPRLYYCRFPRNIKQCQVILMDPVLATSNTVEMGLRILLEHGIREDQIILACIIAAPEGLLFISRNFPKVRIVCSWIDQGLDNKFFVTPGIGYFGQRYFNCVTTPMYGP